MYYAFPLFIASIIRQKSELQQLTPQNYLFRLHTNQSNCDWAIIKNVYLEGVVETFRDTSSGSGQSQIHALINEFQWNVTNPSRNFRMIKN